MRESCVVMENVKIRINKITLWDFKSVAYGVIHLNAADSMRQNKANIMGIYGQNASGKTVVIEALAIIKYIMSGKKIHPRFWEVISNGKDECSIEVEILIINDDDDFCCTAIYKCSLSLRNDPNDSDENPKKIMTVIRESLRARGNAYGEKFILQDIARTDENCSLLFSDKKLALLFGTNPNKLHFLEQQKILALYGSRSFIFSSQALETIFQNIEAMRQHQGLEEHEKMAVNWPSASIIFLSLYANYQFFVIDERTGYNLDFHIIQKSKTYGLPLNISFSPFGKVDIIKDLVGTIEDLLPHLNLVLSNITPGLALECKVKKNSLDENDNHYKIEFISNREGLGVFPFKNESLGIKKIVSFIVLLIEAHNNPSFTLVIDEMDAGIFEYLFGEILDIMSSSGKGQLIFTSHNLRPLERIDPRFVCFTTTDSANRYVQMNKKATNNLRDMYLRALQLGHEDKELYNGDSKHSLAHAFRKMGKYS